ncbi:MAG: hypothetical protein V3T76_00490, partial [candidate division NC10 bacterium]
WLHFHISRGTPTSNGPRLGTEIMTADMVRVVKVVIVAALLIVGTVAMIDPAHTQTENAYVACMKEIKDQDTCLERIGRHSWQPSKVDSCYAVRDILQFAYNQGWNLSWKVLFFNERCARLDMPPFCCSRGEVKAPAMSLSLLKFAGQASLVDEVMLPS